MRYNRESRPTSPSPSARPTTRRLRICKRYPDRAAATEYGPARPFPIVTLRGYWLAAAGFNIGDRIEIVVTPGRLVITRQAIKTGPPRPPS
jgi:hypothetical protein